jgi:hypothetical protein
MSTEYIDEEDYKKIIGDLMEENETLKRRIVELEEMNRIILNSSQETIIETPKTHIQYELKVPKLEKEVINSSSISFQDTLPLEMGKSPIVEGISRRECPICGNKNKALIHEIIDRTHIISAYPRMYGKKYKCGQCGREWRIPVEY